MLGALALVVTHAAASASESVAVLPSKLTRVDAPRARELVELVTRALAEGGVDVLAPEAVTRRMAELGIRDDPAACNGWIDCMAEFGRRLDVRAVVAVQAGGLGQTIALHLELVDSGGARRILEGDVVVKRSVLSREAAASLHDFAVKAKAAMPPPLPESDRPVASSVEIAPAPPPPVPPPVVMTAEAAAAPRPTRIEAWAAGAGGAVALAAAGVTGALGLVAKGQVDGARTVDAYGRNALYLTQANAQSLQRSANLDFTLATAFGAAAVALAVATGILALRPTAGANATP